MKTKNNVGHGQGTPIKHLLVAAGILFMALGVKMQAVTVTTTEMSAARQWVAGHWEGVGESNTPALPFSFRYGGRPSADLLKGWKYERSSKKLDESANRAYA